MIWLEYFIDAYASVALWAGCVEKEVVVDIDCVFVDDVVCKCVELFEVDILCEILKKMLEWLGNF